MASRRILVTGSRTWVSPVVIRRALQQVWGDGNSVLVTGASSTGADRIAEMFWRRWGGTVERHPADWQLHGRSAGFNRDERMVNAGADVCLAFIREGSPGASHTVQLAEHAGIPVYLHTQDAAGQITTTEPTEHTAESAAAPAAEPVGHADGSDAATATAADQPGIDTHMSTEGTDAEDSDTPAAVTPEDLATYYSYPEIASRIARTPADSDAGRLAIEALNVLVDDPDRYHGDQVVEIARGLTATQISNHQAIIGHGPLFDVLGRAAELQQRTTDSRADVAGDPDALEQRAADAMRSGDFFTAGQALHESLQLRRTADPAAADGEDDAGESPAELADPPGETSGDCVESVHCAHLAVEDLSQRHELAAEQERVEQLTRWHAEDTAEAIAAENETYASDLEVRS